MRGHGFLEITVKRHPSADVINCKRMTHDVHPTPNQELVRPDVSHKLFIRDIDIIKI
jgi:hypothetical protein